TGSSAAFPSRVASPTCHSHSFGPLAIVSGSAYLLLRLSALDCLTSLADGLAYYALCCFCPPVRRPRGHLGRRNGDMRQISLGKLNRLRCTAAGSTLRAINGYGLRDTLPARPALAPRIRFLSIGSHLCFAFRPPPRGDNPLRITNPSPPSGWVEDFHLRAIEHARHTTNPLPRGRKWPGCSLVRFPSVLAKTIPPGRA